MHMRGVNWSKFVAQVVKAQLTQIPGERGLAATRRPGYYNTPIVD